MTTTSFTEAHKRAAQTQLVNTSLRVAAAMLFEQVPQGGWNVEAAGCHNREQLMAMLVAIPDDGERIARFSQIARDNGFALAFKSEGMKSQKSIVAKLQRKGPNFKEADLTDLVRISAFSEDVEQLDEFAHRLQEELVTPVHTGILEGWHLKQSGALLNVLKSQADGINCEVQFIPRQQARLATRITHHFYKIMQDYDALDEKTVSSKKLAAIVARYNNVATMINQLASDETLNQSEIRKKINELLSSPAYDYLALDEAAEGISRPDEVRYSEIFKTNRDIQQYRQFFRQLGPALDLAPMPILDETATYAQLDRPMMQLLNCAQITYAGYIQDAPEKLRNRWVALAQGLNRLSSRSDRAAIPVALIEAVPHTLEKGVPDGRTL